MAIAPRNFQDCFADAARAAGRRLDDDEADFYFSQAQARIGRYVRDGLTPEAAAARAGQELGAEARLARAIEKRQARVNAMAKDGLLAREVPGRLYDSAEAVIAGVHNRRTFEGAALSIDAMGAAEARNRLNAFTHELNDAGLLKAFKKGNADFERRVINELGRIDDPTWGRETGDAQAKRMAEIIHKHQDALRLSLNDAGAWIGKLDQYITRQSHDGVRIAKAGFEAWRDFIEPRLSDRTFLDVPDADRQQFLLSVWQALATGIHDGQPQADWIAGYRGPANLAKKMSQERKLLFKDADAWADYNRQFGNGSLNGSVMSVLERGSRNLEAMRVAGTNPQAMLSSWIDDMAVRARDAGDIPEAQKLSQKKDYLLRLYDNAVRAPQRIENATLAQVAATVRTIQRFKLGGSVISSVGDIAATQAMARHNGIGALDSLVWNLSGLLPEGAGRKAALRELDVGFDAMLSSLQTRFGAEDGVPGALTKTVDLFTRASLQPWWTDGLKSSSTLMLANNMAERLGRGWDAQPRRLRTTLQRYGIGPEEWTALQQVETKAPGDGRRYLVAGEIPDATLQRKYSAYLTDQVQEAMSEETPQVRDLIQGSGRSRGTVAGEAWRAVMQFKQFPMSFVMRSLAREFLRDGVDVSGVARLIAGATALGYVSMTIKDMLRGKEPFNPASGDYSLEQYGKNVMRAMAQGGGLGIYGDFFLGEVDRTGGGPYRSLLGPTAGMTADLLNALWFKPRERALDGTLTPGAFAADAVQAVRGVTPFLGLFYVRAAMDYAVLYSLQETLNPGFLARQERRNEQDTGQKYIFAPSQTHLQTFGR